MKLTQTRTLEGYYCNGNNIEKVVDWANDKLGSKHYCLINVFGRDTIGAYTSDGIYKFSPDWIKGKFFVYDHNEIKIFSQQQLIKIFSQQQLIQHGIAQE